MRRILVGWSVIVVLALVTVAQARAQSAPVVPGTLRVAVATDMAPLSVADEGGLRGIRRDLWELWSKTTGIPVRFVLVPWGKTAEAMAAGLADVADPVVFRPDHAERFELSTAFTENAVHIFFNKDLAGINDVESLRPFAIGVTNAGGCSNWLNQHGVGNLRIYPSQEAALQGALAHEVELICIGRFSAMHYLAKAGKLDHFRFTPELFSSHLHWAVAKGNVALRDFIQQGFDRIPQEQLHAVEQRWTGAIPQYPWLPEVLRQIAVIGGAVSLVIALLAGWNWMLRRRVAASVAELKAYGQRFEALVHNLPGKVTRAFQSEDGRFELLYASRDTEETGTHGQSTALNALQFAELATMGKTRGRIRWAHPDGRIVWHDMWATVVARHDRGIEYETLILDVTSEVEAKQALEKQQQDQQLLERRIQEASKLEALGKLAGGIAHDFNNLLGGILGFASLVAEDIGADHPTQKFVSRISAACLRGKDLVDQILAFARQSKGEPTRFSLDALVTECRPLLDVAIPSSISIDVWTAPEAVDIQADKGQIGQVLMNLCFNARDALENKTGTIAIGVRILPANDPLLALSASAPPQGKAGAVPHTSADGWTTVMVGRCDATQPHAVLSVKDSGSGMEPELLARVFEPFFTTKATGKGTGLGLSVVHGIVMAHDGALLVRSRPGSGTEIQVILPLAEGIHVEVALPAVTIPTTGARHHGRVLVVDDDGDFGDVLALLLGRRGWSVSCHADPRDALAALTADPKSWTFMVTDQVMPHLRGEELIAKVKAIRPDLPCLLCTGYDGRIDEEQMIRLGIAQQLRKPLEAAILEATIADILAKVEAA